jgi:localization factor PodJL
MAATEFQQQIRQGVDALRGDETSEPLAGCRAGDLKGLLNAIVDQISEADRRHSDTLQQLQERLAGLGRDAKAIKPRVPDTYAAAFERIEAGMAELATRIAEASEARTDLHELPKSRLDDDTARLAAFTTPATPSSAPTYGEAPAALRSASENPGGRRREEPANRMLAGVDTFDVIESLPGNVSDPWDRDAAEALTGHYESGASGYQQKSASIEDVRSPMASLVGSQSLPPAGAGVDHSWLEQRFSEISKRIEESISDIRPDQGFFALGQRVDQFEQHVASLFEGVATKGDVEGVRLIEAHVSELAAHLENAHQQLMRLDAIEDHLVGIADKLDVVHSVATLAANEAEAPAPIQPNIDLSAVARTAAEAAAQQFAKIQSPMPVQDNSELRDMLRGFIADSRQGEENTNALLDTLQQAMIRLLDRVDAMELNALQSAQAHSVPQDYGREQVRFGSELGRNQGQSDADASDAINAAVAAVASAKTISSPYTQSQSGAEPGNSVSDSRMKASAAPAARSPEQVRQDFIAEARRAKMRLAAESEGDDGAVALAKTDMTAEKDVARPTPQASRSAGKAKAASSTKDVGGSSLMPKLRVLALASILAVGGAFYVLKFGIGGDASQPAATSISLPKKNSLAADAIKGGAVNSQSEGSDNPEAQKSDRGTEQMTVPPGTRGEIITDDLKVGSTTIPLYGVAVDSEKPITAAELARAQRQQAMAAVSEQLGHAVAENPSALSTPAALHSPAFGAAGDVAGGTTNVAKGSMSQSSALDLPPVTVGPLSLRLAAANGDPSAEFEVGARLAEGKGTDQSFKDAAKWYQRSASHGFAQAQYRLGTLYERGLGLKPDIARAADWYKRAAEQGNVKAMHNLAVLSANQSQGSPDYKTAATWFEKAAEMGLSDSQFNLAVLHENGLGVSQDLVSAYKWLIIAAKSGDKEAIKRRDILQGKLTGEQISKADAAAAGFKAKSADPQINDPRRAGEAWKKNPVNGVNG